MRAANKTMLLMAAVTVVLSACNGGDGSNAAGLTCRSLDPLVDGANQTFNCAAGGGCSIDHAASAADGNFGSSATLRQSGATSGFAAVNVKASNGGVFARGTTVGVIWEAAAATQNGVSYQLNTYLAGVMQDSFVLHSDSTGSPAQPIAHSSRTTTLPYDTVEFRYLRATGTTTGIASVYELCAD